MPGWPGAWSCAPTTVAAPRESQSSGPRKTRRGGGRPRAPGAGPSSGRPTCATRWSPRESSSETFESAITWDRFDGLRGGVARAAERAVAEVCGEGRVTCRLTHAYPDGAAPYFTVLAPARRGLRARAMGRDQAGRHGGDHRRGRHGDPPPRGRPRPPAADTTRQRPEPFAAALRAAKAALDPAGDAQSGRVDRPVSEPASASWRGPTACSRACGGCGSRCRGPACRT